MVCYENYLPRLFLNIKSKQTSFFNNLKLFHTNLDNPKKNFDYPGIWPILRQLIYSIQYRKSNKIIKILVKSLENLIRNKLVRIRTKLSNMTGLEWIKSLKSVQSIYHSPNLDKDQNEIDTLCNSIINLLQFYQNITDFVCATLAGDIDSMKYCLCKLFFMFTTNSWVNYL